MTSNPIYLLPVPNAAKSPENPVDHLLEALDHIAKTPCSASRDVTERRELFYLTAASQLANTYPELEQQAVYDRHAARYPSLNSTQQRIAALSMHGLASDRATGTRVRDGHTWAAAAIAALELYRTRKTDRSITSISVRLAA